MTNVNKTRIVVIALVIAVLALFAYAIYHNSTRVVEVPSPHEDVNARADAMEAYIMENLATLSPVQPTMGGSFYITRLRLLNGEGTVNYEDGHMAYVADFTYTISEDNRQIEVTSFTLQK